MDTQKCPIGYERLNTVLDDAMHRAAFGKGHVRHATNYPFEEQFVVPMLRELGIEPALYQIVKKAKEVPRVLGLQSKVVELLDVIVYAAAAVIVLEEVIHDGKRKKTPPSEM